MGRSWPLAYADLGDHRSSFARLKNALKPLRVPYDERAGLALLDRIEAVFTADLMPGHSTVLSPFT